MPPRTLANGLANYWMTSGQLTDFEKTRIMALRAVMISEGKIPFHVEGATTYVEEVAELEMRNQLLGGLVPCREAHLASRHATANDATTGSKKRKRTDPKSAAPSHGK